MANVLQAVAASGCPDVHLAFIAKEDQCAAEVVKRKLEVICVFDTQWWARDWLTLDGIKTNILATELDPAQIMQVLWLQCTHVARTHVGCLGRHLLILLY